MRVCAALVACALTGCSFVGVRGPVHTAQPQQDVKLVKCTDSSLLPSIDAVMGSFGVAGSIFGAVLEQTAAKDDVPDHFTKYYAGPMFVLGVAYLWAASFGTDRVEQCIEAKQAVIPTVVEPIDMGSAKPPEPQIEIE